MGNPTVPQPENYTDDQGRDREPTEREPQWSCGCRAINWPDMSHCWKCSAERRGNPIDAGTTGPGPTSAADEHPAPDPPVVLGNLAGALVADACSEFPVFGRGDGAYTLGTISGERFIVCNTCHRRSFHATDIQQLYCGHCHVFHRANEYTLDAGLAEIRDRIRPECPVDAATIGCVEDFAVGPSAMTSPVSVPRTAIDDLAHHQIAANAATIQLNRAVMAITALRLSAPTPAGAGSTSSGARPAQDDRPPTPADFKCSDCGFTFVYQGPEPNPACPKCNQDGFDDDNPVAVGVPAATPGPLTRPKGDVYARPYNDPQFAQPDDFAGGGVVSGLSPEQLAGLEPPIPRPADGSAGPMIIYRGGKRVDSEPHNSAGVGSDSAVVQPTQPERPQPQAVSNDQFPPLCCHCDCFHESGDKCPHLADGPFMIRAEWHLPGKPYVRVELHGTGHVNDARNKACEALAEIRDKIEPVPTYYLTPGQYTEIADAAMDVCREWGNPDRTTPDMNRAVLKVWEMLQEAGIADQDDTTYIVAEITAGEAEAIGEPAGNDSGPYGVCKACGCGRCYGCGCCPCDKSDKGHGCKRGGCPCFGPMHSPELPTIPDVSTTANSAGVGSGSCAIDSSQVQRPQPPAVFAPIGGIKNPPDVETITVPRDLMVWCWQYLRDEQDARELLGELSYILRRDTEARLSTAEPAAAEQAGVPLDGHGHDFEFSAKRYICRHCGASEGSDSAACLCPNCPTIAETFEAVRRVEAKAAAEPAGVQEQCEREPEPPYVDPFEEPYGAEPAGIANPPDVKSCNCDGPHRVEHLIGCPADQVGRHIAARHRPPDNQFGAPASTAMFGGMFFKYNPDCICPLCAAHEDRDKDAVADRLAADAAEPAVITYPPDVLRSVRDAVAQVLGRMAGYEDRPYPSSELVADLNAILLAAAEPAGNPDREVPSTDEKPWRWKCGKCGNTHANTWTFCPQCAKAAAEPAGMAELHEELDYLRSVSADNGRLRDEMTRLRDAAQPAADAAKPPEVIDGHEVRDGLVYPPPPIMPDCTCRCEMGSDHTANCAITRAILGQAADGGPTERDTPKPTEPTV